MAWRGIVCRSFTAEQFGDYVAGLKLGSWKPRFVVLHNTAAPTLAQWHSTSGENRMRNLERYYRDEQHWSAGPHLFIADDLIWVLSPLTTPGVHSPSWNSVAWGVEMVGDYSKEPFNTGAGARVRDNAVAAIAALCKKIGAKPESLRLHKEDPRTTHDCPGKNVDKADFVARVKAKMAPVEPAVVADAEPMPVDAVVTADAGGAKPFWKTGKGIGLGIAGSAELVDTGNQVNDVLNTTNSIKYSVESLGIFGFLGRMVDTHPRIFLSVMLLAMLGFAAWWLRRNHYKAAPDA